MSSPRRRSPAEKKALSYAKDRRNTYGENPAASRKGIRLRKRAVNQANRLADRQLLRAGAGPVDDEVADDVGNRVEGRRRKRWAKAADTPLGQYLAFRSSRGG